MTYTSPTWPEATVTEPDRNVTPSTTDSSHNAVPSATNVQRLAEIRARLDTGHKDRGVSCCRASQNHDRLAEIRARLDVLSKEEPRPGHPGVIRCSTQMRDLYADDIAWLLDEVERLAARVRMYEEVKS